MIDFHPFSPAFVKILHQAIICKIPIISPTTVKTTAAPAKTPKNPPKAAADSVVVAPVSAEI